MRIDEIDIYGDFKLNGLTGNTGQFLGMSGSQLYWLDAGASTGGVSIYGTRYVYCNADPASATMSGLNLINALGSASSIAGLSVNDRAAVLVSPGVYDFYDQALTFNVPYVDLVGINSDANSVRLKASNYANVIYLEGGGIDMGLYNLSIGTASLYNVQGAGGDYQRWNNVINYGDMFSDISTSIEGLDGDFRNIKVYNSTWAFAVISGSVDGVFDNIEIFNDVSTTTAFYSDSGYLFGTYSNITIHGTSGCFFGDAGLSGYFENIKGDNSIGSTFYGGNYLNATIKNIEFKDLGNVCASTLNIDLIVDNVKINSISQGFVVVSTGNIVGTFSNIEIGSTNNLFFCSTSGDISGTYKDITCNNTSAYGFSTTSGTISGTFENITLGDAGESYFRSYAVGGISGTFKNIEMGDITSGAFYSSAAMNGTFSNIKTDTIDSPGAFYSGGDMSGKFEDIEIGTVNGNAFYSVGNLTGEYKNIIIGTAIGIFNSEGSIGATFSNIELKDIGGSVFYSEYNIDANVKDVSIDDIFSSLFLNISGSYTSGNYENIKVKSIGEYAFYSATDITGIFKNIDLGLLGSTCQVFSTSSGNIYGTYEDIEMDASGGLLIVVFRSVANIIGTFKNINTKTFLEGLPSTVGSDFFTADVILATCSNIYAGGFSSTFNSALPPSGTFTNLNLSLDYDSRMFGLAAALPNQLSIYNSKIFGLLNLGQGKIVNSLIDCRSNADPIRQTIWVSALATIERCKVLADPVDGSARTIYAGSGTNIKLTYSILNRDTQNITNLIAASFSIIDASIT